MSKATVVMRGDALYTLKQWPEGVDNPGKFRWAVYRDGIMVGGARTWQQALDRIESGWWEPEEERRS